VRPDFANIHVPPRIRCILDVAVSILKDAVCEITSYLPRIASNSERDQLVLERLASLLGFCLDDLGTDSIYNRNYVKLITSHRYRARNTNFVLL
jgi:hypothetical protein